MDIHEVIKHLKQIISDNEKYAIPAQETQEAIDLFEYDNEVYSKAIELLEEKLLLTQ